MTQIEKMRRYVERTAIPKKIHIRYDLLGSELVALGHSNHILDMATLAFNYGMAKGYRAAQAERRARS